MHGSDPIVAHRLLASPSAEKDDRNWAGLARGVVSGRQHRARFVVGFPVGVYSRVVVFLHVTKVAPRTMRCCTCAGDTGHDSVRLPATSRRFVRVGYSSVLASGSGPPRSSFVSRCLGSSRPSAREVVLAGPRPTASCPGAAATRASSRVGERERPKGTLPVGLNPLGRYGLRAEIAADAIWRVRKVILLRHSSVEFPVN